MAEIVKFQFPYHYAVKEYPLLSSNKELISRPAIVLKNCDGYVIAFTGLEYFAGPYKVKNHQLYCPKKNDLEYICKALNYILFEKRSSNKVSSPSEITAAMVMDFFEFYCTAPKTPNSEYFRGQQSIDKCVKAVSFFFANMAEKVKGSCSLHSSDLLEEAYYKRDAKSTRTYRTYAPIYRRKCLHGLKKQLTRDIPAEVISMLLEEAQKHDPMLAFAIVAQITLGVRPSELMNFRQEDSPLSDVPGITFYYKGSAIYDIDVDLTKEYLLRSDGKSVGGIKKERTVPIYKAFIEEFMEAYRYHKLELSHYRFEAEYAPMFVTRDGKAMTYKTYYMRFKKLVSSYLKPRLLASSDPEQNALGQSLDSAPFTPHALRHYFTVRLVEAGLDCAEIMKYRGDTSPESVLPYLNTKGSIKKKLTDAHEFAIKKASKKGHSNENA